MTASRAKEEMLLWKPLGNYGDGSSFSITPPTVPEESQCTYNVVCHVAKYGPHPPKDADKAIYDQYMSSETHLG